MPNIPVIMQRDGNTMEIQGTKDDLQKLLDAIMLKLRFGNDVSCVLADDDQVYPDIVISLK